MFQARAALQSFGSSGSAVQTPRKRRMAAMFVARSGRLASGAFSRKPGPMWSKVGGFSMTAPPTRLTAPIRSSPYART
jgi:hypothetical protein